MTYGKFLVNSFKNYCKSKNFSYTTFNNIYENIKNTITHIDGLTIDETIGLVLALNEIKRKKEGMNYGKTLK